MSVIRFFARLAFRLLLVLLGVLMQLLLPILLIILRILRDLVSTSLSATIHGPRQFIERLASEWTQNLLDSGVSRDHLDQLYGLCRFLAGSKIILGWVVAALFTVAILRIVFGFFI